MNYVFLSGAVEQTVPMILYVYLGSIIKDEIKILPIILKSFLHFFHNFKGVFF